MKSNRLITICGGIFTGVALALVGLLLYAHRDLAGQASTVHVLARYESFPSLSDITRSSDAVVQVKVIANLGSRRIPLDPPVENNAPPPTPNAIAAQKLTQVPTAAPATPGPTPTDVEPLETTYLVQVKSVLHGHVQPGDQLRIVQRGGRDTQGTEVVEGNPLLVVGDQEIMFLSTGDGGTYFIRGGPEGRFGVIGGTVVARGPDTPVGKDYDHRPLASFVSAVHAAAGP